jgi:Protein of unknown function (DUF3048) N-terminal domain/Protein of unknown function (DUF3048) C-terminal domain
MAWTRQRITYTSGVAFVLANLVVGALLVSSGGVRVRQAAATPAPTHPATHSPSPSSPPQLRSPFTGEPVSSLSPVLAVKIDNSAPARPQTGLTDADIVYVLPVEGGLSRLMAIFSSHYPTVAGPVRSARQDDLTLLRQFGQPGFAYSGATRRLLRYIHRTARIVNLYAGTTGGYYRNWNRAEPYNLYAYPRDLLATAASASPAHGIGFRFGPPPPGGRARRSVSVSYPSSSFTFTWSAAKGRWLVSMDGTPAVNPRGVQLSAATVVIQHTTVRTSGFLERGRRPPFAQSTGSGRALVLRNGQAWAGRWSRPRANEGTTFTTAAGGPMTFARGQVWIVLAYP